MNSLLTEYPKTTILIKQWFLNKMLESLKDPGITEDFKDSIKLDEVVNDEQIARIVDNSPRALFDIFDSYGIYINVLRTDNNQFIYSIKDYKHALVPCETRLEADRFAIVFAFKILEEKL